MTAPTLRAQVEIVAAILAFREKQLEGMIAAEWDDENDLEDARQAISALAALIGIAEAAEWETKRADAWEGRWRLLMKLRFGTKSADEIQADPLLREMQSVELQMPIPHPARYIELDRRELAGEEPTQ